jgi:Fe-S oxidoreductase
VLSAVWIRKVQRPDRFKGSHLGEADLILALIAGIVTTLLLWHASRIALDLNEWPARWSPVSNALSTVFGDGGATKALERVLVWAHLGIVLGFLAYLPHSKHLHIATAGVNVWFGRTRSRGRLEPLDFTTEDEAAMRFGTATVTDMTWKQMIDTMSCTECGRCQDVCPAYATGKELSPKLLIMGLRDQLFTEAPSVLAAGRGGEAFTPTALVGNAVSEDVVWDCVTCGACVHECPVAIEHVDHIVDLRRSLVMVESRFPTETGTMMRDLERAQNPWGKPQTERADWADGLDVRILQPGEEPPELLYWVGCAASFDDRARQTARSLATLLDAAGLDWAILGPRECCTGDPARRIGNEYTFQAYAEQNVTTLGEAGVTRIVATCPHCFNTLSNEYPDFGGRYEVVHHTELLAELVRDGRLRPAAGAEEVAYHDSCYLARHNDVIAAPREVLRSIAKPLELTRSGKRTFCCGAGGAHMWMEERGTAINEERAREAVASGAQTLAVACPFCTVMLDDGVRQIGGDVRVADVATLLAEALPATQFQRQEDA